MDVEGLGRTVGEGTHPAASPPTMTCHLPERLCGHNTPGAQPILLQPLKPSQGHRAFPLTKRPRPICVPCSLDPDGTPIVLTRNSLRGWGGDQGWADVRDLISALGRLEESPLNLLSPLCPLVSLPRIPCLLLHPPGRGAFDMSCWLGSHYCRATDRLGCFHLPLK